MEIDLKEKNYKTVSYAFINNSEQGGKKRLVNCSQNAEISKNVIKKKAFVTLCQRKRYF